MRYYLARNQTSFTLCVFGSKCWYTLKGTDVNKLDSLAGEATVFGCARGPRGYKFRNIKSNV